MTPMEATPREAIAKHMADRIGHGMEEKCYRHADAVLEYLTHIYNSGYNAGHHYTVEGGFVPIDSRDMNRENQEDVDWLVCDLLS